MGDVRMRTIDTGVLSLTPEAESERWEVTSRRDEASRVAGHWDDWIRLAKRVLEVDALWRDREARGDAWDEGHAAGAVDAAGGGDTVNPFR
jgi:hypothetical protein